MAVGLSRTAEPPLLPPGCSCTRESAMSSMQGTWPRLPMHSPGSGTRGPVGRGTRLRRVCTACRFTGPSRCDTVDSHRLHVGARVCRTHLGPDSQGGGHGNEPSRRAPPCWAPHPCCGPSSRGPLPECELLRLWSCFISVFFHSTEEPTRAPNMQPGVRARTRPSMTKPGGRLRVLPGSAVRFSL